MGQIGKTYTRKLIVLLVTIELVNNPASLCVAKQDTPNWPEHIRIALDATEPLKFGRGDRLPLYLWQSMDPGPLDDQAAVHLVNKLNERGVGLVTSWNPNNRHKSLAQSLTVAKAQKKLGLGVNINATRCLYLFFNGDIRTAHIDEKGQAFWDESFGKHKMGCPFALDFRRPVIKEQIEHFVRAFKEASLPVDFIFADWEIDGPIEFNQAHAASRRCRRCRENIENIDDFEPFQKVLRRLRCDLQRQVYAEPIQSNYPDALVGNYGVYPHNGYRYWYDYYEYYVEGQPFLADQRARYRKWYHEFAETGYTFAMPVVYPWCRIFDWYDYADTDYRWFYNMLMVASNAGKYTPTDVPIISFVHWHTIETKHGSGEAVQFSEEKYQELLWHMLLRGTDTFFLWCPKQQAAKETRLVHQVYADAQQYGDFLSEGTPINFDVPKQPETIVSGLKLKDRVLIRRTDFEHSEKVVAIAVEGKKIKVLPAPQRCQIISLR